MALSQLSDVVDECLPPSERAALDPFGAALVAALVDDPYATLKV